MNTLDFVDQTSLRDDVPEFGPGDTVNVHVKVIEGSKERVQVFKGVVIRRQGGGVRETFTEASNDDDVLLLPLLLSLEPNPVSENRRSPPE